MKVAAHLLTVGVGTYASGETELNAKIDVLMTRCARLVSNRTPKLTPAYLRLTTLAPSLLHT